MEPLTKTQVARILHRETANDRFKQSFGSWLGASIIVATLFHFALISYFPTLRAADFSFAVTQFEALELPPEVEIPPPPEEISRPALPIVAETELEEEITIAPTTFEENPVDRLPAPPEKAWLGENPTFTPYTVAPTLKDPKRAARIVERYYPGTLKDAGVGGRVVVWAFIDEAGKVLNTKVNTSSGYDDLDRAAMKAALEFEFNPAFNRDIRVQVWVALPIRFRSEF